MYFQIPKKTWTKTEEYLDRLSQEESPGFSVDFYLDFMEQIVNEYDLESLEQTTEHFCVLSQFIAVFAVLLSNGKKQNFLPVWKQWMNRACAEFASCPKGEMFGYSMLEILLAYHLMHQHDTNGDWAELLSSVEVLSEDYDAETTSVVGLCIAAGETLRLRHGLGGNGDAVKRYLESRLEQVDENGCYADESDGENSSFLYDLSVRVSLQLAEVWGERDFGERLRRGGIRSLMMQSPTGEIPGGGRFDQYLFRETLFASMMEYEAGKQAETGNTILAGRMRRSARLAVESVRLFLDFHRPVRNLDSERRVGLEKENLLDSGMISVAAALTGAVLFAKEEISERVCPCQAGGYLCSYEGGRLFAVCCGYGIQLNMDAGNEKIAVGLGRIQREGAPGALGLSVPFSAQPYCFLPDDISACDCAVGVGWDDGGGLIQYLSDVSGLKHSLSVEEESSEKIRFTVTYTGNELKNCGGVMETYTLDQGGVHYSVQLLESEASAVYVRIPLLMTDGNRESKIRQKAGECSAVFEHWRWRATSNASMSGEEIEAANPNGVYRIVTLVRFEPKIRVNFSLVREKESGTCKFI